MYWFSVLIEFHVSISCRRMKWIILIVPVQGEKVSLSKIERLQLSLASRLDMHKMLLGFRQSGHPYCKLYM